LTFTTPESVGFEAAAAADEAMSATTRAASSPLSNARVVWLPVLIRFLRGTAG